jgi:hypothetical protein
MELDKMPGSVSYSIPSIWHLLGREEIFEVKVVNFV